MSSSSSSARSLPCALLYFLLSSLPPRVFRFAPLSLSLARSLARPLLRIFSLPARVHSAFSYRSTRSEGSFVFLLFPYLSLSPSSPSFFTLYSPGLPSSPWLSVARGSKSPVSFQRSRLIPSRLPIYSIHLRPSLSVALPLSLFVKWPSLVFRRLTHARTRPRALSAGKFSFFVLRARAVEWRTGNAARGLQPIQSVKTLPYGSEQVSVLSLSLLSLSLGSFFPSNQRRRRCRRPLNN